MSGNIAEQIINNKELKESIEIMSHLAVAILLCVVLKDSHPYILTGLLLIILGYIVQSEKNTISIHLLPSFGLFLYSVNEFINYNTSPVKYPISHELKKVWKAPLFGILSYYMILALRKN